LGTIKIIILALLFQSFASFAGSSFDASKISKETASIVNRIAENNAVKASAVGYAGVRPEQFDNFAMLEETASISELIELTNHPNAAVRCYSFWALTHIDSVDLFPIIIAHISDTAMVERESGCEMFSERVGDFYISLVTPKYVDLSAQKFTAAQFLKLDSVLLSTPNHLQAKDGALNRAEPTKALYSMLRNLVIEEHNEIALVKLATYKQNADVDLILNFGGEEKGGKGGDFYIYRAIQTFPHPRFLPLLKLNLEKSLNSRYKSTAYRELYKAIAKYKNEHALALLQAPFTQVKHEQVKKYHLDYAFNAVQDNYDPVYDDLLWQFWEDEQKITFTIYKSIVKNDSARAIKLVKKSLLNIDAFYGDNMSLGDEYGGVDVLIRVMLEDALNYNQSFGFEVIRKGLIDANVHIYDIFTNQIIEIKAPSFVEPLFERFKKESNPHIYLAIAKALISYNDEAINQRILETIKKNKHLRKGWGASSLDTMLVKNGIK
jgi:hypothetical protein